MVCLRNMCMATLNKGDNDSHNNNNNTGLAVTIAICCFIVQNKKDKLLLKDI